MSTAMPQLVNSAGTPNPALEALQTYKQRDLTKGAVALNLFSMRN